MENASRAKSKASDVHRVAGPHMSDEDLAALLSSLPNPRQSFLQALSLPGPLWLLVAASVVALLFSWAIRIVPFAVAALTVVWGYAVFIHYRAEARRRAPRHSPLTNSPSEGTAQLDAQIIAWIGGNLGSRLDECAKQFGLSPRELHERISADGPFKDEIIRQHRATVGLDVSNPRCPSCGGNSARIGYGYPLSLKEESLGHVLDVLAGYATWSHGCEIGSRGEWKCNSCGHMWGNFGQSD